MIATAAKEEQAAPGNLKANMDETDKILSSLSLDTEGIGRQFMSLTAIFNIGLAAVMGFLVLLVYLSSSSRENRDRNLFTVIPVLAILMAVMMRIEGPQVVVFFGIFGILSIVRFRSDLTDQKGITFILFAVIEGVLVGLNAYLLAFLAWLVVGGVILLSRRIFSPRVLYRLVVRLPKIQPDARNQVAQWLGARGIEFSFTSDSSSTDPGKSGAWEEKYRLEFLLFPSTEELLSENLPALATQLCDWGMEMEIKRVD